MTDRAQAKGFCSCSPVPAHISDSVVAGDGGPDDRATEERQETSPARAGETKRNRFCTCSDVPTRPVRDEGENREVSEASQASGAVESSRSASEAKSYPRAGCDGASHLGDLPELESLTDLLPGETSLFAAFTHGDDGSEVLLTDRRVMLRGAPDAKVLFSSLRLTDVDSVSVSRAKPNRRSFIWGLIGLGASVGMWQALDGVGNLRLIIAAIVVLMSAVLLADYALRPPDLAVVVRAKSGTVMTVEFAQNRTDAADRFAAKVVAALEALRTV